MRNRRDAECSNRWWTFRQQMKFMALPGIIGVGILYLIPGCALFYYALINNVFQKKFVGLENFLEILSNPYFLCIEKYDSYAWTFSPFDAFVRNDSVYPCGFFRVEDGGFFPDFTGSPCFMPSVLSVEIVEMFGGQLVSSDAASCPFPLAQYRRRLSPACRRFAKSGSRITGCGEDGRSGAVGYLLAHTSAYDTCLFWGKCGVSYHAVFWYLSGKLSAVWHQLSAG